jgi:hypothetical protein
VIIVIAGCDVDCHFISASCYHSGSTNDIIAWQNMDLYEAVEIDKKLPPKYFFIGDEAFTNTMQFLSPWPGKCCNTFASLCIYLYYEDVREGDEWAVYNNAREDDVFLCGRASGDCRCNITARLESLQIIRPMHAQCNSHVY